MKNSNLANLVQQAQNKNGQAILQLIECFKPILIKYSNFLNYEDAYNDLQCEFIYCILKIKLFSIYESTDKFILSYIKKSIYHAYIKLSKKKCCRDKETLLSSYNLDGQNLIDEKFSYHDERTGIVFSEIKKCLSKNEYKVIYHLFVDDLSVNNIANMMNTTRQNVNQTKNRAIKKLHNKYLAR